MSPLATPLLADACICVFRRLMAAVVFQAHRLHLFQRLNQAGWFMRASYLHYCYGSTCHCHPCGLAGSCFSARAFNWCLVGHV